MLCDGFDHQIAVGDGPKFRGERQISQHRVFVLQRELALFHLFVQVLHGSVASLIEGIAVAIIKHRTNAFLRKKISDASAHRSRADNRVVTQT